MYSALAATRIYLIHLILIVLNTHLHVSAMPLKRMQWPTLVITTPQPIRVNISSCMILFAAVENKLKYEFYERLVSLV